jgi:predicted NAD/FAD-binding protein
VGCNLGDYIERRGYGSDFMDFYLVPMSSAVWSTPADQMREFPATTLLRFFHNHGFLGLHTQHPWQTVSGGAKTYVEKLTAPFANRIRLGEAVLGIQRSADGVKLTTHGGHEHHFDRVILACHADQALGLLRDADPLEQSVLREFRYQKNVAQLHTDESLMPKARLAWSSWNYRTERVKDGSLRHQTLYWMNALQKVSDSTNYFVSINGEHSVNPERVLRRIDYEHPLFTLGAIRAQHELPGLNRRSANQRVYLCGSYFRYGFHEDAFSSAVDLCRVLAPESMWA